MERERRVGGPCGVTLRLAQCLSSARTRRLSLSLCDQWVRGGRRGTHNGEPGVRLRHHLVSSSFHYTTGPGSPNHGPGDA
ncbi:hypothetical protein PFLUV_G00255370 [Perca fluviatilis]|uniref:Uncharacterized protein n=1 Tax=Perca fluviatilis TaxID=8168 RepID=A0A6A5E480_PERFL|nr:hypothetical protein PFLUV_G00255370 [Perca fluviatilis]